MTAYLFDEFALNTSRCRLMRSDKVIELRPKSFEVLRHLVENADRLITKDELLNAVWPGVHVSEDSLTQCVMEVRRALDDKNHALLKTVPKRGYIFAGTVLAGDEGSQSAARTSLHGRWRWDWLRPTALVLGGLIAGVILTLSLPLLVGEIEGARHIGNLVSNAETAIGQTLATYPTGTPAISVDVVPLPPGAQSGWHSHPVPVLGYVLEGQFTTDYGTSGLRTYRAGDVVLEAVDWPHNARNLGTTPTRILIITLGVEGQESRVVTPLAVRPVGEESTATPLD